MVVPVEFQSPSLMFTQLKKTHFKSTFKQRKRSDSFYDGNVCPAKSGHCLIRMEKLKLPTCGWTVWMAGGRRGESREQIPVGTERTGQDDHGGKGSVQSHRDVTRGQVKAQEDWIEASVAGQEAPSKQQTFHMCTVRYTRLCGSSVVSV